MLMLAGLVAGWVLVAALSCLHGAWADRTCQTQVIRYGAGHEFMQRPEGVAAWRDKADRAIALLDGLRVTQDDQAKLP